MPECLRALSTRVPKCLSSLNAQVPECLKCPSAQVPQCSKCPSAQVSECPPSARVPECPPSSDSKSSIFFFGIKHSCNMTTNTIQVKIKNPSLTPIKSLTLFFKYFQQDNYKIQFLVRGLSTRLQFELFISFHPSSLFS